MRLRSLLGTLFILAMLIPAAGVATGADQCDFPTPMQVSPTSGSGADLIKTPTIQDLTARSDVILQARVRDWNSYYGPHDIQTDVSFDVERVVAGTWMP